MVRDVAGGKTGVGLGPVIIAGAVLAAALVVVAPQARSLLDGYLDENDEVPIELDAEWGPGDNEVNFHYDIGPRSETLYVTGPRYTHDDVAVRGQHVALAVTMDPNQPVQVTACYIEYGDAHVDGVVTPDGAVCTVETTVV